MAAGPLAVAVKSLKSTGRGLVRLPSVQMEKLLIPVLVTVLVPSVTGRWMAQGPLVSLTDLNKARLAVGMPLSSRVR